jgi:hypothetical protein
VNEHCKSFIFIDGGNDTVLCRLNKNHLGNHQAYRIPEWTNEDSERAKKMIEEDYR